MIKLTTTAESSNFIKVIVYGGSGVGKTWLIQTAPKPVIISAEKGLLTLKEFNIPVIEIKSFQDLEDAYVFITTDKRAKNFETICLDSISDIAETVLAEEKTKCGADPRQAYGAYADKLLPMIKKFRDLEKKNVYFTAKLRAMHDEFSGITSYLPSMPGQQLGPQLPYLFDFSLVLRVGQDEDGNKFRFLQTESDVQYTAKARGGKLEASEPPDLGYLFKKVLDDIGDEEEPEEEDEELDIEGSFEEEGDEEIEEEVEVEGEGEVEVEGDEESNDEEEEKSDEELEQEFEDLEDAGAASME